MNDKLKPASHQPGKPPALRPYTPPQIIYESELEIRAGSPLGIPGNPLDLLGLDE